MRVNCSGLWAAALAFLAIQVSAAPITYTIDSGHTYPSFEADHSGGLSIWRGKFNSSSGTVVLDREAQTGTLDVTMDASSIDFGHERMNQHAMSADMLDTAKFPTAKYKGELKNFENGVPTSVEGTLTLRGVTKPVSLSIDRFKCMKNPRSGKEKCGANAVGQLNREEFGITYGKDRGFEMGVTLAIQVEAERQE